MPVKPSSQMCGLVKRLGYGCVAIGATLLLPGQGAQGALVGHWALDEASGATTALDSTGGTNGAVGSNVTTGLTGIAGNAYRFNGDLTQTGIVDMGNATSVFSPILGSGGSGAYSISAWVNWTDNASNRRTAVSMATAGVNTQFGDLGITGSAPGFNTQGGVYAAVQNGASSTNRTVINTTGRNDGGSLVNDAVIPEGTGTPLNDGQWHHLVMTVDSAAGVLTLYADGASVGTATGAITLAAYDNLEFGRLGRLAPANAFIGMIDDVQIYDEALSASDVATLFSSPGTTVPEPGALALLGAAAAAAGLVRRRRCGAAGA